MRLFSARQELADELYQFLHPDPASDGQDLALDLSDERFPFHDPAKTVTITRVRVFIRVRSGPSAVADAAAIVSGKPLAATLLDPPTLAGLPPPPWGPTQAFAPGTLFSGDPTLANLPTASFKSSGSSGQWSLHVAEADIPTGVQIVVGGHARLDPDKIADIGVLCEYTLS